MEKGFEYRYKYSSFHLLLYFLAGGVILALLLFGSLHKQKLYKQFEILSENINNQMCDMLIVESTTTSTNDTNITISTTTSVCGLNGECYFGICICDLGFQGPFCNETCLINDGNNTNTTNTTNNCFNSSCCGEHGECWYDKCICNDGWFGELCDMFPNSCPGNISTYECETTQDCLNDGVCHYGKCLCSSPNYWGSLCNLERRDLSFCTDDEECLNGGMCIQNLQGNGECFCPVGTIGNNCQTIILIIP